MKDIFAYRDELQQKLATVETIIAEMGVSAPAATKKRGRPPGSGNGRREKKKGKRKMSAAGRAAIRAAQKARWAKLKAAGKG